MEKDFSIGESIRFGWERTRSNSSLVFKVVLVFFALTFAHAVLNAQGNSSLPSISGSIFLSVLELLVGIGSTIITLKLARKEVTKFSDIIPPWSLAWRYLVSSLLAGIIIAFCTLIPAAIGWTLFNYISDRTLSLVAGGLLIAIAIIVGAYLVLQYSMVKFVSVDEKRDVLSILRYGASLTKNSKLHLLGFFIVILLLNLVGALLLFVGLLISIPVSAIASAHVYTKLTEKKDLKAAISVA